MERTTEIHLALPRTLVVGLDRLARERGVRRTQLLREAILEFLKRVERERSEREMSKYVEALSAHSDEFVAETDVDTVQRLLRNTEW